MIGRVRKGEDRTGVGLCPHRHNPFPVASASHGSAAVGCVLDREEALGLAAEEETPTPP